MLMWHRMTHVSGWHQKQSVFVVVASPRPSDNSLLVHSHVLSQYISACLSASLFVCLSVCLSARGCVAALSYLQALCLFLPAFPQLSQLRLWCWSKTVYTSDAFPDAWHQQSQWLCLITSGVWLITPCAKLSGTVYCNQSCLCVCLFVCVGVFVGLLPR